MLTNWIRWCDQRGVAETERARHALLRAAITGEGPPARSLTDSAASALIVAGTVFGFVCGYLAHP